MATLAVGKDYIYSGDADFENGAITVKGQYIPYSVAVKSQDPNLQQLIANMQDWKRTGNAPVNVAAPVVAPTVDKTAPDYNAERDSLIDSLPAVSADAEQQAVLESMPALMEEEQAGVASAVEAAPISQAEAEELGFPEPLEQKTGPAPKGMDYFNEQLNAFAKMRFGNIKGTKLSSEAAGRVMGQGTTGEGALARIMDFATNFMEGWNSSIDVQSQGAAQGYKTLATAAAAGSKVGPGSTGAGRVGDDLRILKDRAFTRIALASGELSSEEIAGIQSLDPQTKDAAMASIYSKLFKGGKFNDFNDAATYQAYNDYKSLYGSTPSTFTPEVAANLKASYDRVFPVKKETAKEQKYYGPNGIGYAKADVEADAKASGKTLEQYAKEQKLTLR